MLRLHAIFSRLSEWVFAGRSPTFRRSAHNAGWSAADYLVLPLLTLIATPIFVHRLGVEHYGVWMLVNSVMGFGGVLSFGIADATIKYVSHYRALRDLPGVVQVIRSTMALYALLGTFACAVFWVLAPLLVHHVFKIAEADTALAIQCLRIAGVGIGLRFIDGVFLAVLSGFERYDLAAAVSMPTSAATVGLALALALGGLGLVPILASSLVILLASSAAKVFIIRRKVLATLSVRPLLYPAAVRQIFAYGFFSWLQGIGGVLLSQFDRFLLASLLGPSALTYYTVCLQLALQVHMLPARAFAFLFPLASAGRASGDTAQLRRVYFSALDFTTAMAIGLGLPIFLFAGNILTLWMGADFAAAAAGILQVLVFGATVAATSIAPYYYLNGAGYVGLNTLLVLVSGAITALGAWLLIPWIGIVGAAWGRLCNLPTSLVSRTFVHRRVLADPRWYAAFAILAPVFVCYAVTAPSARLLAQVNLGVAALAAAAGATAVVGFCAGKVLCGIAHSGSGRLEKSGA